MYQLRCARSPIAHSLHVCFVAVLGFAWLLPTSPAQGQSIVQRLEASNENLQLTVNTSRILTLDQNIPRVQVNNPEILSVTPLSKNQVQILARRPGVTDVNLWDENGKIYSVNVVVYGDVAELQLALKTQYPTSSVTVHRYSNSLVLSGFVDSPEHVSTIVRLAEDYSPKVINNMTVAGVQQILLNVQVMEVSRTKLRALGFDFTTGSGNFATSGVSGLITAASASTGVFPGPTAQDTIRFGILEGDTFLGFLRALRQNDMMKILAEPKLITVSGRPATFNSGGEFPVRIPQGLGTVAIEYKKYGTQVEFLPLVLNNGSIRLEVRPRVSEIDSARSQVVDGTVVHALRVREVDTAVEMKAGQTLALAGLIQTREEAVNKGLPVLADIPFFGAAFRSVQNTNNEIELLILVRPEFADAMDPHECPPGGPGLATCSPNDHDLYCKGFMEVPCGPNCTSCATGGFLPLEGEVLIEDQVPLEGHAPQPPVEVVPTPVPHASGTSRRVPTAAVPHRTPAPRGEVTGPALTAEPRSSVARSAQATTATARTFQGSSSATAPTPPPGLIGPVGYDVAK